MNDMNGYFGREYFTLHQGKRRYICFLCNLLNGRQITDVLDIGCGYGFFLWGLDHFGYATYGIDSSKVALRVARVRTKAHIALSNSETLPFHDDSFDAVTTFDVIEHIENYKGALREVHRVLRPGGTVYIITLNGESLLKSALGRSWSWYKDPTHKHLFSPSDLKDVLECCGFEDIRTRTFFNFNLAGESTKVLRFLRPLGRTFYVPKFGDSILATAKAKA
jgi:ubiquinone/menaquinone biosynthesis C-methylase UbiE